jgi:diaminohydroxyphosphoribosylaminopyrimidine deaminase/5-amino-6-(5-phosphoribosylamino)uracil reductase
MMTLIEHARCWRGKTGHNPTVAAGVVVEGDLVAIGVHRGDGTPHAEVDAIRQVGQKCKGATLLVTLEPCTHFGKTPPCVNGIIDAGFSKVIFAIEDPNPKVRAEGGAERILKEAGIEVEYGVCESEAYALNREFFYTMQTGSPFFTLKIAQSHNAQIPLAQQGNAQMISSEAFLKEVHFLRAQCDVLLTGIGTILSDNPQLNVRYGFDQEGYGLPHIVILDPSGRTPCDARVFGFERDVFIVVDPSRCDLEKKEALSFVSTIVECESQDGVFTWDAIASSIHTLGFRHCLVESGPTTMAWALPNVQEIVVGVSPKMLDQDCVASPLDWRECEVGFSASFVDYDLILRKIDT